MFAAAVLENKPCVIFTFKQVNHKKLCFLLFCCLFGFGKRSGFALINVVLCCICVFTFVEEKIHLCLWEFSGTLGEEMQPIIWAWMLDLGGKMDQTWVLGYLGMVGDCEGII